MRRWLKVILPMVLLLLLSLPSTAASDLPEEYRAVVEELPNEILEYLPDGIGAEGNLTEDSLLEASSPGYLLSVAAELLGISLSSSLRLFAALSAILVLCALFREVGGVTGSGSLSSALRFCSVCCLFLTVSGALVGHLRELTLYFDRLNGMMGAMIPVTGTVWAMGGNVSTATAGTATLYSILAVSQALCSSSLIPMVGICTTLILCNMAFPDLGMGQFLNAVRKLYTVGVGFVMTLLVASLAAQTAIGSAADGTAAKAAKFLSSTVIPVVGGSVGDTLRTVASGVIYVKSVVGVSGILFVLLLLLPILVELLVCRLFLLLGSGGADMLGCSGESRLLSELGTVYGTMIGVVSMTGVMFVLSFVIFMQTAVAVS